MEDIVRGRSQKELFNTYFNNVWNREILKRAADKCYRPANKIILENIDRFKGEGRRFKVSFSLLGTFLERCERWASDVLDSFRELADRISAIEGETAADLKHRLHDTIKLRVSELRGE